jgi:hypothetical protein
VVTLEDEGWPKGSFYYLSRSPFRQTRFDVSIPAQDPRAFSRSPPIDPPSKQEDNLRSTEQADAKFVLTGDMEMMKIVKVDATFETVDR